MKNKNYLVYPTIFFFIYRHTIFFNSFNLTEIPEGMLPREKMIEALACLRHTNWFQVTMSSFANFYIIDLCNYSLIYLLCKAYFGNKCYYT